MIEIPKKYPRLTKSYKGFYPFRLSTTSFIYPDNYIPNVKMLGPFVDEIELLLFESNDIESLFSAAVIDELQHLARDFDLTYNIHLPTDIAISAHDDRKQQDAVETFKHVIQRLMPLEPSVFCLHVPYNESDYQSRKVNQWRDRIRANMECLLSNGTDACMISIETLDYPLELIEDIIADLDFRVCLDVGHLILHGNDIGNTFNRFSSKISIIHLHGVDNNRDHLSLDLLPEQYINSIIEILSRFTGIVSLEVFSYAHLKPSLHVLETWWNKFITPQV